MLEALGLDEACETVYRAVLAHPQAELELLRERLGLPDAELRLALDKLSEMALVRPSVDQPDCFRAVDPEVGIQAVIARQQERLAVEQQRIEQIRLAAAQLAADFTVARPPKQIDGIERLDGIEEIRERIGRLVHDVRTEVMTLAPGGAQSAASMEAAKPQDQALLERGVRMRTLYLDSVRNSQATVAYANWLAELNGEVRTTASLPIRLMILDRRVAIVPTDEDDSRAGALVLSASGTVTALCALFDTIWEPAMPMGAAGSREREDDRGLSPQEAETLRLLGQGFTDDAVAKRLGVSPRTARRIAADLMEKLGARSRFQAGTRAVAKGWLTGEE
ncbi:helix-turn-helix transcriptional regulator [Streptomyces lunaelactis]|uniref:Helix-turn-helix transcriptional regulator n=1 Tax=Streptomyces lunaelactis TaxID=1535768 RepID=A0A2R4SW21_9ACTN|nr:LuxR family transcriptional regulator [Streptomyces lunaelactis]AVZ71065.1 helix-turn-helix transcriptional regulator [Streptomyces lunaelactis]NUK22648.1 helix-turn-helix transcriptional regulator [Streptomyces lunaelactis]NUK87038.1 helix-turn-helix transcriptional regulator [Streptomyces lunaelactis]